MQTRVRNTPLLRYKWSHLSPVHRAVVRLFNGCISFVPFRLKYSIGWWARMSSPPYSLVGNSDIVVQIGAPSDTLWAGRSRAMYFALANQHGRATVVIEPDRDSVAAFRRMCNDIGLPNVSVVPLGAWSKKGTLRFYFDRRHPATNFTKRPDAYDEARLAEFEAIEVEVDTLDNIVESLGIDNVGVVSITTNGAEQEILKGMERLIQRGLPFICLARTDESHEAFMSGLGYRLYSHDDRGYTFIRTA